MHRLYRLGSRVKRLWLFCFPLLFLPSVGLSLSTHFGVLEVSDWLIVPFIVLLMIAPSAKYNQNISKLSPLLWSFLAWSLLSTLSIHFRYDYIDDMAVVIGSSLKLARFVLYGIASVSIARKLSTPGVRLEWLWSLLAALLVLSLGLLWSHGDPGAQPSDALEGYKSYNTIIVVVAILCSYVAGLWVDNVGSRRWSQCAGVTVVVALGAVLFSSSVTTHGRGGWVAFVVGFGYVLWKRTQAVKTFAIISICCCACFGAYAALPAFKSLVDLTVSPRATSRAQAVDDGARLATWVHEAPKLKNAPLFGSGFYHRGGASSLWTSGSHNFFIQMFLETGVVGGCLVVLVLGLTWRQAGLEIARRDKISLATRAALITAMVGGMSGEYYYGGIGLLAFYSVFAIAGSLPSGRIVHLPESFWSLPLNEQVA
jgi:O-antigen ligase/polysaccharide polymerase Wzy-like membrane protein